MRMAAHTCTTEHQDVNLIRRRASATLLLIAAGCIPAAFAAETSAGAKPEAVPPATLADAIVGGETHLDFRYRLESVDQEPFADDALASTLRSRLSYRTREWRGWGAFAEVDNTTVLGDDEAYNSTTNGVTDRPTIADPEYTELNQAYVQFQSGTFTAIGGRQRITLDNQRFIGAAAFRQNEQTFDALTLKSTTIKGVTLHYSYIANDNRVYGPDEGSQSANFHGPIHALNSKVDLGAFGAVSAFGYLLDIENAPAASSQTYGALWTGTYKVSAATRFGWAGSYASQADHGDNRNDYSTDYYLLEASATHEKFGVKAGYEVLGGSREPGQAFQTPLASLHVFQGWADRFLTTPAGGVADFYVSASGDLGPVALQLVWHDFAAEALSLDYGSEWDASAACKFGAKKNFEGLLKFADYQADGFGTDTTKVWLQFAATF